MLLLNAILPIITFFLIKKCESSGLERLIDNVFVKNKYNNLVRPTGKNGLTKVETELKILQIDLDEKYQQLISTVWLEMTWNDDRMVWNPTEYDNITEITLPVEKLWIPDIVLQNGVGKNEYLTEYKLFNPWISHNGAITWVPEIRIHTKCLIKVKDFPFDRQCCEINFYSWAHTARQMNIQQFGNKNKTNITHLSYNTEWQIYDTCAINKTIVTSEDLNWWVTSYVIYIKRESIYHSYTLLMPCTVLSMLSILLFLLPPDSGEKVTLGVTILLAFFVNSLVVSNYTPEATSELPVIGVYYIFNIVFVSLSLASTICVLNFHYRGHKRSRLPIWIKKILLMKVKDKKLPKLEKNYKNFNPCNSTKKSILKPNNSNAVIHQSFQSLNTNYCNMISLNKDLDSINSTSNTNHLSLNNLNNKSHRDSRLKKMLEIVKQCSHLIKKEQEQEKHNQKILLEWKEAARRIDNIFFVISMAIVDLTPLVLFGKYYIQTDAKIQHGSCACDYFNNE